VRVNIGRLPDESISSTLGGTGGFWADRLGTPRGLHDGDIVSHPLVRTLWPIKRAMRALLMQVHGLQGYCKPKEQLETGS
jgi:hypothetical protein